VKRPGPEASNHLYLKPRLKMIGVRAPLSHITSWREERQRFLYIFWRICNNIIYVLVKLVNPLRSLWSIGPQFMCYYININYINMTEGLRILIERNRKTKLKFTPGGV
jgi:hypothetical protein